MRADELLTAIRQRLGAADDEQLGHRLCNSARPAAWREKAELSPDDVADLVAELEGGLVRGSDLVQRLLKLVDRDSRREAAPLLGVSYQTLVNWTEHPAFTTQDIARILKKLGEGFTAQAHRTAVEPLV